MSVAARLAPAALLLAGCASAPPAPPPEPTSTPGMAGVDAASTSRSNAAPVLSHAVLPSLQLKATLTRESLLLQRPQRGSAVLRSLPAGTVTDFLGELDNAEGQWLSVAVEGTSGWLRAADATRSGSGP